MRKRTKVLTAVLCLVMFFVVAQACGAKSDEKKENQATENKTEVGITEGQESGTNITIEEQVLFEQDGIVVTAKEYVTDDIWGDGIKLLIENNSDKSVTIGCNALIVNNYMISDLFVSGVAPGKKANKIMYLSNTELEAAGIDSVGQVEAYFHVYDTDTYETLFDTECVTIQTSEYENMDTTADDTGVELYNDNGVRILAKTVDENSFWGTAILLYCENNSGKNIGISVDEMSINGFMMNPLFTTTVYDGKMALDEITIFSEDLVANGIENIEDVELKFHIYDAESYEAIADSEVITFSAR
ncbi:MAG: hypothetical protein IJZ23_04880 [Roseburia sp.]|nr:hypothetical protein [Roseburia sp.]